MRRAAMPRPDDGERHRREKGAPREMAQPGLRRPVADMAGLDRAPGGAFKAEDLVRGLDVPEDRCDRDDRGHPEAALGRQARQLPADPGVADHPFGHMTGVGMRQVAVRMVDGEGFPVGLAHDEPPDRPQDPADLTERGQGIGDVLQDPAGAGAVGGVVGHRQVVDVRVPDVHHGLTSGAGPRGAHHGPVVVDADDGTGRGDCLGERLKGGTGATAEVEHPVSGTQAEFVEHPPLVGAAETAGGEPVERADGIGPGRLERGGCHAPQSTTARSAIRVGITTTYGSTLRTVPMRYSGSVSSLKSPKCTGARSRPTPDSASGRREAIPFGRTVSAVVASSAADHQRCP